MVRIRVALALKLGASEGSIGAKATSELAVMLDTTLPLRATAAALSVEDPTYQESFIA